MRKIPDSGINLFQSIYVLLKDYREKMGQEPLNLSLGNPDQSPAPEILELESRFAKDSGYEYHTYAEDKNLGSFVEGMLFLHAGLELAKFPRLEACPISGIKTASALIPLACGAGGPVPKNFSFASNLPAYDIAGMWAERYLGARRVVWPLLSSDRMRLNLERLKEVVSQSGHSRVDLIFTVRPGNPAAVGASAEDWKSLIEYCLSHQTRLVNDAAYAGLVDKGSHVSLAAVAKDYPDLEWLELYSVSKSFSDPGARLGAMVGSRDFIRDYLMIKGNTDSGPVPFVMAAYGEFFKNMEWARQTMKETADRYQSRLGEIVPLFKKAGLVPACETEAGFFTLWKVPRYVLGVELSTNERARNFSPEEAFNRLVISETGLAGVHFSGFDENGRPDPLIRYAVCADVFDPRFQKRFRAALSRLNPRY